ncbi:PqiC family protein [Bordetella genomosp. 9]|uniref:PqiC family protein n=1 Tax=Bordetella genomosp. 9 TaxID=1416803 RepID=UPI000A32028D|nr:PqiC family protein [Bordetella genomosp. 9]
MKTVPGMAFKSALLAAAFGLAGCATSPPVHYYTLLSSETPQAGNVQPPEAGYLLEVVPVTVPPQADQPQIMIREAGGGVSAYYSDRWTAPLGDEIRGALSYNLVRMLGAIDVQSINAPAQAPVWRVQVDVQRFDAMAGGAAVLDATWRIRPLNLGGAALLCRTVVQVPLGGGRPADAAGAQQRAVSELAATIATGIRAGGARAEPASAAVQLSGCRAG